MPSRLNSPTFRKTEDPLVAGTEGFYPNSFDIVRATTEESREQAYRLRYQVYCVETEFENPTQHPDGMETDAFDSHSAIGLLIHRESATPMGAVRLILPLAATPERSFPIQTACRSPELSDPIRFPVPYVGEVSRFCISKTFRKRREDPFDVFEPDRSAPQWDRRVTPHLTLKLIEVLVVMSIEHGISCWCAIMEPALLRLLGRLGIHFDAIGPVVDHHGPRQPCYIELRRMLLRASEENLETWNILTDHGSRWDAIRQMPALCN